MSTDRMADSAVKVMPGHQVKEGSAGYDCRCGECLMPTPHEYPPDDAPDGWYWACEQPERPPEPGLTVFDSLGCPACAQVAKVLAASDDTGCLIDGDGEEHPLDLTDLDDAERDV